MNDNFIESQWLKYREKVLPKNISKGQYDGSRLCFIAGFVVSNKYMISLGDYDEETAMKLLDKLNQDLDEIVKQEINQSGKMSKRAF